MKTLALALLLFGATSIEGRHISQSSMGGDLDVKNAPHGATLRTMGGDIRVGTARGRVVAKTMGGNIEVRELVGSLEAGTMGGNVEVGVARGDGNIEISSMGGHIEITLPADFSGSFDIELEQDADGPPNEIVSDFPLQIQEKPKNNWFRPDTTVLQAKGISGSGTHRVKITTIGGDVRIRRK
jgi:DUF4097 and DUF4098 domain-containing protein YvlB